MTANQLLLQEVPLCVDLDGALVKSDTLQESIVLLARLAPWKLLLLPFWLLRGRSYLKHRLSQLVNLDPSLLPYNTEFLEYVRSCHHEGRPIVLVTAASERIASTVSKHLGLFTDVLSSSAEVNLKGKRKRDALNQRFGSGQFDYAGNSMADLTIWECARRAVLVHAPWWASRQLRSHHVTIEKTFNPKVHPLAALIRAARPHQWVKNVLIFLPVLLAHGPFTLSTPLSLVAAFLAFSLTASSVYLTNDLLDIHSDRQHPKKRHRPLASGDLPVSLAVTAIPLLLGCAFLISLYLPVGFTAVLGTYLFLASAYSLYLKKKLVLDTLLLAVLYGLRLFAGGAATQVPISPWLLAFSIFFFFSLALMKRTSELQAHSKQPYEQINSARGYLQGDLAYLPIIGISAGLMSAMIFALYIQSPDTVSLYKAPQWLWLVCVMELYWITRLWILALRGRVSEDPILFASKDKVSYFIMPVLALLIRLAI